MIQNRLIILFLLISSFSLNAQNFSKEGVLRVNIRSSGSIMQNGKVKGYFFFYRVEKKDNKNYNYMLSVYDENLREINSTFIARPKMVTLVQGAFNGQNFGFLFYDSKAKSVELIAYDQQLKALGSVKKVIKNKFQLASFAQIVNGQESDQAFLVPVENQGFLYYGLKSGSKLHYEMEFFNNNMKLVWSEKVKDGEKQVELASEAFQTEKYVGSIIVKKPSVSSKNMLNDLEVHELATGKVLFRTNLATDKYSVSLSDVFYDDTKKTFTVFGEYFNIDDKELKARSLGFITLTYDFAGKLTNTKTNSWVNEISKAAPVNERGKFDGNNTSILFHNIIRTKDGRTFVIGEQYKKAASAAGIVSNVLVGAMGGGPAASNVQLNIYNMVVFEFKADYTLEKVHVFEKDKSVVTLPAGMGNYSPRFLSYYAKAVGGFDYSFTQMSDNKETFFVSYIDYDKEKGEKAKNVLGTIVYTPEKVFTVDKLPLTRKSTSYYVYRAKEGYVLVVEYFKKEKRLDTRLEKVNY